MKSSPTRIVVLSFVALLLSVSASSAQVEKLPPTVNSPIESDLLPVITADGKTLYFLRTRTGIEGEQIFDIWSSTVTNDTIFSAADVIGGPLASRFGIAVTSVSPDNNTLYLIGKLTEDTPPEERLLVTHRTKSGWSIPEPLHIDDLHARNIYTDYSFGPDQKTLLISVERDSSIGSRDLYVSFRLPSGDWSTPRWLGPQINSAYTEMTPYLAADNRTLYFSSDRPGGIGDVDVYRSTRLDDSWRNWSAPENLGAPINRGGRTTFYTEDASGTRAYFCWSATAGEQADIYRARIKSNRAVALVRGRVLDGAGNPVAARVYYTASTQASRDSSLGSANSNPATGEYQLVLPAGRSYVLFADKEGYFVTTVSLDLSSLSKYQTFDRDLILTQAEVGTSVSLQNILFEPDRATLLPASDAQLDQIASFLERYPKTEILVRGHTDSTGSTAHNIDLSRSRAESVKRYLTDKGIAAARIQTEGKGAEQPIASNSTEAGKAMNRRVEFVIIKSE